MRGLEINRRRESALERVAPSRHANAPAVAWLQSRKTPFRMGRDEIVAVEHREIEKIACDQDTNGVESNVLRAATAITVAIEAGQRITAT